MLTLPGATSSRWLGIIVDEQDVSLLGARVLAWRWPLTADERDGLCARDARRLRRDARRDQRVPVHRCLTRRSDGSIPTASTRWCSRRRSARRARRSSFLPRLRGKLPPRVLARRTRARAEIDSGDGFAPRRGFSGRWGGRDGERTLAATLDYLHARGIRHVYLGGTVQRGDGRERSRAKVRLVAGGRHPDLRRTLRGYRRRSPPRWSSTARRSHRVGVGGAGICRPYACPCTSAWTAVTSAFSCERAGVGDAIALAGCDNGKRPGDRATRRCSPTAGILGTAFVESFLQDGSNRFARGDAGGGAAAPLRRHPHPPAAARPDRARPPRSRRISSCGTAMTPREIACLLTETRVEVPAAWRAEDQTDQSDGGRVATGRRAQGRAAMVRGADQQDDHR
jgi:hypothetical protein